MNSRHSLLAMILLATIIAGCSRTTEYPNRPITLICPWAAGGGTDRVSRQIAMYLEHELGVPVNVINATGGQGVTGHSQGLLAPSDGYTLAMMTLELNTMHWRGLTNLDWQDCEPLMSLNEDPAALFVRTESPIQSMQDLEDVVTERPGELTASGTASLAAWHLALAGWLLSIDRAPSDIAWIPSQGSAPSLQELMSGGIDIVCCSVPEARSLLDSNSIRCIGIMSDERITQEGLQHLVTLKEQGADWILKGWRGLGLPKGTPPEIRDRLAIALRRIVTGESVCNGQTFPDYMDGEGFDRTWRETADFAAFMQQTDKVLGELLTRDEFKEVKSGPVGPMAFPLLAACLAAFCLTISGVAAWISPSDGGATTTPTDAGSADRKTGSWTAFLAVPLFTAAYALLANTVGFLIVAAGILFGLAVLLKAPLRVAVVLAVCGSAGIYQVFTGVLRVTLPMGWFGW